MKYEEIYEGVREELRYEDLILGVQLRAGLDSIEDARVVCQATLITLGECLAEEEIKDLTSQLPVKVRQRVQEYLADETSPQRVGRYSSRKFYCRVGEQAGLHLREARRRSSAVVAVLEEVVRDGSDGSGREPRAVLPEKFDRLVERRES